MFTKILIANRGEIACRVIRTAKRWGIKTVAVYSEADQNALHVSMADESFLLGPAPAQESYLNIPRIIEIAKIAKAKAIHPGYGFLSENVEFAQACLDANIIFIGPTISAIADMGSKSAAKIIMEKAKVPLIPGYHGHDQTEKLLHHEAKKIGYPIILKPAAGGGGKGMMVVTRDADFSVALAGAKRLAKANFADDTILIEKYLANPRHIEIQVFADQHGNCVHLFERDCSIQRRHQKIIEEAPAPNLSDKLRHEMGKTAIAAAKAINYLGAGTIEFLLDENNQFYFMEMNTRLQVEHPVTEMITGLDLVEWQFRVAAGEELPLKQDQIELNGHAIEVRIYAEDPQQDFRPSMGQIKFLTTPRLSQHVRIDSGISVNDHITPYYDPMIAKLCVWDVSRHHAINQLQAALTKFHLIGVDTNLSFLSQLVEQPDYQQGNLHTDYVTTHMATLLDYQREIPDYIYIAGALYTFLVQLQRHKSVAKTSHDPHSPWALFDGWQLNLPRATPIHFSVDNEKVTLSARLKGHTISIFHRDKNYESYASLHSNHQLTLKLLQQTMLFDCYQDKDNLHVFYQGKQFVLSYFNQESFYSQHTEYSGHLSAPMPGTIVAVLTTPGKEVSRGEGLIVLEAMKMEHTIQAPKDGIVSAIHYRVGEIVEEGAELIAME